MDKTNNRFEKIEEAPAIKTPTPSEAETIMTEAIQKIEETGSLDETHAMLSKLAREGPVGA